MTPENSLIAFYLIKDQEVYEWADQDNDIRKGSGRDNGIGRKIKKSGNPVGIRTQTNWTKTSCATITQRGYSRYFVIYSNVCNLQIKKADFFK